ncbi:MAG: two-component system, sensor histidine kinase YesM [Clostridiales bacterium]|nr:two-component system, sensor histidine kinase YesM [Clostridiales bacterium]MDK2991800.1 two-component system, sensor histidine kinase YesM [Clostridiales bacterium]
MKFKTLKQRLIFTLTIGMLMSFMLMAFTSYNAIYSIQQNKINTSIASALERFTDQCDRDYYNLMQITQQMMPQGYVGSDVDSYFFADQQFDKAMLSRRISNNIEMLTYSYPNVQLVMYYNREDNAPLFSNLPPSEDLLLQHLPNLKQNLEIAYQPPHSSGYRFSGGQVISVTRDAVFSNSLKLVLYAETKNDMGENFDDIFGSQHMPYILLQIDKNQQIKYSSNSNIFKVGETLNLDSQKPSGTIEGYIWNRKDSHHGFTNVLLLPISGYNRELYAWRTNISLIAIFTLLVMVVTAIMLRQLIYKPLYIFEEEMKELGNGNMTMVDYNTGVEEFDHMFDQFNAMKMRIQSLMQDIENKERQRHKLEIEKLSYQINPHFLMNALNSAHWMAVMHQQHDIDNYISKLNYILSYSLGKSDQDTTLRTEIKMLKTYIELQKMRYDFEAHINIEDGFYLDTCVPRLILQPLAENAICHGLDENGILNIDISADYRDKIIKIIIADNGKGLDKEALETLLCPNGLDEGSFGQGIGLRYVYLMLESFYGRNDLMYIESGPAMGTKVMLFLPFQGR